MSLITIADLDARRIEYVDAAQAQAAIDDVSAVARECVAPLLDDVQVPDTPATVVAIVAVMVRRALTNPRALAQESLGDYSYSTGGQGVASLLPTLREKKQLRRAVGKLGAGSLSMEGYLPRQLSEDAGASTGGDITGSL